MTPVNDSEVSGRLYKIKAVIDVGSTSIRMVIAQVNNDGSSQIIDALSQSVAIGRDTFTEGKISRVTTEDCVKVLRNFSSVLAEYKIRLDKDVRAVATSAVREARNREAFLDRIYMATDIHIEAIEGTEVNRLTFLGVQPLLHKEPELKSGRLVVAEVGGGTTDLLGLEDGRVSFAHTYRVGSYRLRETIDGISSESQQLAVLDTEVDSGVRQMREATGGKKTQLILMGGDARFAAELLVGKWTEGRIVQVSVLKLAKLAERTLDMSVEQLVTQYQISYEEAQTLGVSLQIYVRMARGFKLKKIYVCGVTLRDGLVAEIASGRVWGDEFVDQILHSAREIGRRYQFDEAHAGCVTQNALKLFDALADEHRLSERYRLILNAASWLHDIGMFIRSASHHKHGQYIIENSDVFGLSQKDIKLVALVARYHRGAPPRASHADYNLLSRDKRLAVSKLASILRVADALDRSHTQALCDVKFRLKGDQLIIETKRAGEFAAEKQAMASKSQMFEQVYGCSVALRTVRKQG